MSSLVIITRYIGCNPLSTLRLAQMPRDILIHIAHICWTNEASESCCCHKEGIAPGHQESLKNERLTSIPSMFESFWLMIIQVFPNYRPCYFVGSHPCLSHIAHWGCQIGTIAEWREAPPSTISRRVGLLGAWEGFQSHGAHSDSNDSNDSNVNGFFL